MKRLPSVVLALLAVALLAASAWTPAVQRFTQSPRDGVDPLVEGIQDQALAGLPSALRELVASRERTGQAPSLDALLAGSGSGVALLPIPDAPQGDNPLQQALLAYAQAIGVEADADALLAQQATLGALAPEAERALARLVLAYAQALQIEAAATAALDAETLALARGDTLAMQAWAAAHPGAGTDGLLAAIAAAGQGIDQARLLQAASLLSRTLDAVRGDLATPALDLAQELEDTLANGAVPPSDWRKLRVLAGGADPLALRSPPLAVALADLARSVGVSLPASTPTVPLPPSLESALATIVAAEADGLAAHDPPRQAATLLAALQSTMPTLQAWSAVLSIPPPKAVPDTAQVAALAVSGAGPAALAAASFGIPVPTLGPAALQSELLAIGLSPAEAAAATASLPPNAAAALATVLAADAALATATASLREQAGPAGTVLLASSDRALDLAGKPTLTDDEAAFLRAWAVAANASVDGLDAVRQAQVAAAVAAELAADLLGLSHDGPVPPLPPLPESPVPPPESPVPLPTAPDPDSLPGRIPCPDQSDLSSCDDDVYLYIPEAGILVTGPRSTQVDSRFAARIILDLGGDDVYTVPAGASGDGLGVPSIDVVGGDQVEPFRPAIRSNVDDRRPFKGSVAGSLGNASHTLSLVIDAGGDDAYESGARLAQGAASGLATVGLLLDLGGDDRYHRAKPVIKEAGLTQGGATVGGLAALLDTAGNDTYLAEEAMAQGVAIGASYSEITWIEHVASTGILLDLGQGADRFTTRGGQGYATGIATTGILVDEQGVTVYDALLRTNPSFQGGRDHSPVTVPLTTQQVQLPGLALLVDLGGPGDFYSAEQPLATARMFGSGEEGHRRQDDTAWFDLEGPLALGLDASLEDADDDGFQDAIEMLAGTDPKDPTSTPTTAASSLPETLRTLVFQSLADPDGDGFANATEIAWGTDPDDPDSNPSTETPGSGEGGFLLQVTLLCPAGSDAATCQQPCNAAMPGCIDLVAIGATEATVHGRPALIGIDLGGDDQYPAEVAGPGRTTNGTFGSVALDLDGDDVYGSPTATWTQAAAQQNVAFLLDVAGDDTYQAASSAQASALGNRSVAMLADFSGNDRFLAGTWSQASARLDAVAALADLGGDDQYNFSAQAEAETGAGAAVVFDAAGHDTYRSLQATVRPEGPDAAFPATVFDAQGRLSFRSADNFDDTQLAALGLFLDAGPEGDTYIVRGPDGGLHDVSHVKDSAGVVYNDVRNGGERDPTAGIGYAIFADGLTAGDDDQDGWPALAEMLLGTDAREGGDRPTKVGAPDPDDPTAPFADPSETDARPDEGALSGLGLPAGIFLPGLAIRGAGDDQHGEYVPFLVDLGGDDEYTAANAGGTANVDHGLMRRTQTVQPVASPSVSLGSVVLQLDVGAGDDRYQPRACSLDRTESNQNLEVDEGPAIATQAPMLVTSTVAGAPLIDGVLTLCPSLGGTIAGVAVAADDGGHNLWRSSNNLRLVIANPGGNQHADAQAWAVSQGASFNAGAGLLLLWNGTNDLVADVTAEAQEDDLAISPSARAVGLAQGAAWGRGLGGLWSLGGQGDSYVVRSEATADLESGSAASSLALAQGAALGGIGILIDDGGANRFEAQGLLAQGAAQSTADALASAWLWSGPGDDRFTAGPLAQAGARATSNLPALAVLVDGGGSDVYRIDGPVAALDQPCPSAPCAVAQAATKGMTAQAAFLDFAGDDQYLATGWRQAQGAADGGRASFLDLGGHDRYEAGAQGQGYVSGNSAADFIDASGADSYKLDSNGQGYGQGAAFLDGGGQDVYKYGAESSRAPRNGNVPRTADGNDWTWVESGGTGADAHDAVGIAFGTALPEVGKPSDIPFVTIALAEDARGARPIGPGARANGTLHVLVHLRPMVDADRVAILLDGTFLGDAERVTGGSTASFHLEWPTAGESDDGLHTLRAMAVLSGGRRTPLVGSPDAASLQSPERAVVVDNPPAIEPLVSGAALSPSLKQMVDVSLVVPRDHAWPSNETPVANKQPGAWVTVELVKPGAAPVKVNSTYLPAGPAVIHVDGHCPSRTGPACPDGRYDLVVRATDVSLNAVTAPSTPLLIDGTAPSSTVGYSGLVNRTWKVGQTDLRVPFTATDPNGTEAAGLASVVVAVLDAEGNVTAHAVNAAGSVAAVVPLGAATTLSLVTVAVDALGNSESPCKVDEPAPCVWAKLDAASATQVTPDFGLPTLAKVEVKPAIVRPGQSLSASAIAQDVGPAGLDQVRLQLTGGLTADLLMDPGADNLFTKSVPVALDGPAAEKAFNFQVIAIDEAGNRYVEGGTAHVDGLAPRLQAADLHFELQGKRYDVGQRSAELVFEVLAEDLGVASVNVTLEGDSDCTPLGGPSWECRTLVPADAEDGTVTAVVTAVDTAGNVATLDVPAPIAGSLPELTALRVVEAGPDRITVAWNSSIPTDAQVAFGTDAGLGRLGPANQTMSLTHVETITGLRSATAYHIVGLSTSQAGRANQTEAVVNTTSSGFLVALHGVNGGTVSGTIQVLASVATLAGNEPVQVTLLAQDAAHRLTPIELAPRRSVGPGLHTLTADTTRLGDGDFEFLLQASRGPLDRKTVRSPVVHVDNTPAMLIPISPVPGSVVGGPPSALRLLVTDPLGGPLPDASTLAVTLDGKPVAGADGEYLPGGSALRTLRVALGEPLTPGPHVANVVLSDPAGNVGAAQWSFEVDDAPPSRRGEVEMAYKPGPLAARPNGTLEIGVRVEDAAGIGRVEVDLGPLGGPRVALRSGDGLLWHRPILVPATAPTGTFPLNVTATDGLGNQALIATIPIVVDADLPRLVQAATQAVGWTAVTVELDLTEPATVVATGPDGQRVVSAGYDTHHEITIPGLAPGANATLRLVATDGAGNEAVLTLKAALPDDAEAPGAPLGLVAASPDEAVVELRWQSATDNAGVAAYEVLRQGAAQPVRVPANQTSWRDESAPPGQAVVYEVTAIDLAGQRGPPAQVLVSVRALPKLLEATLGPAIGPSDEPFHVEVLYRHPSGQDPDLLELRVGGQRFPLQRADPGEDCATGCRFQADVLLPPRSVLQAAPTVVLHAEAGGETTETPLAAPFVLVGDGPVHAGSPEAPATPLGLLVLVLALVCFLRRRPRA